MCDGSLPLPSLLPPSHSQKKKRNLQLQKNVPRGFFSFTVLIHFKTIDPQFIRKTIKSAPRISVFIFLKMVFQLLAVVHISTTYQGSRKGHILSQQGPSQTFCRLFVLTLLTAIRPRTGAKTAKTCDPKKMINTHR